MNELFASPKNDVDRKEVDSDRLAKEADRRRSEMDSLLKSGAFRNWLFDILDNLCGFDNGLSLHDDFVQGKRASASYIKGSLLASGEGPDVLAEMTKRYYTIQRQQENKR